MMKGILLAPEKLMLLLALMLGAATASTGACAQTVSGPVTIDLGDGAITALSWEFAVETSDDSSAGSTRRRSAPAVSVLRVTRRIGDGSVSILSAILRGRVLPSVILVQGDLTIELKKVQLAGLELQGASYGNELAAEIVEFAFEEIRVQLGQDEVEYGVAENA
jgi:type VI protein secretion system component Hcp